MWEIVLIVVLLLCGMELIHRYIIYCIKDYIKEAQIPGAVWGERNLFWTRWKNWIIKHLSRITKKL